jgi:CHRD domain-containing protein
LRRLTLHAALVGLLLVVFGAGSYAVADDGKKNVKSEDMSGYLEAPALSTGASGKFTARIDDSADEIHYELSYQGLEGTVAQAHIHIGQRSVSGGISAWLCETATNQNPVAAANTPTCPQSGTVTGTITPVEVVGPAGPFPPGPGGQGITAGEFEELVAAIRAGVTYANVHSSKFAPGEIRGQIDDPDN